MFQAPNTCKLRLQSQTIQLPVPGEKGGEGARVQWREADGDCTADAVPDPLAPSSCRCFSARSALRSRHPRQDTLCLGCLPRLSLELCIAFAVCGHERKMLSRRRSSLPASRRRFPPSLWHPNSRRFECRKPVLALKHQDSPAQWCPRPSRARSPLRHGRSGPPSSTLQTAARAAKPSPPM